ncbi:telomere length regulation protein [Rhizina undulata]
MIVRRLALLPELYARNFVPLVSVRALHHSIPPPQIPPTTTNVPNVETFLTNIGRNSVKHSAKFTSWEQFFSSTSSQLRELGVEPARDRKYIINWREKFRLAQGNLTLEEHKRGRKIDGGERRRKEVRAKRRAEENKERRRLEEAAAGK